MYGATKIATAVVVVSFASCLSTVRQKAASFFPARNAPTEQEMKPELKPPVVITTPTPAPTPPPIAISTGRSVIAAGGPSQTFVKRASKNVCASGTEATILYFNPTTAVLARTGCKDIEPTTLPAGSFSVVASDSSILIYDKVPFDRDLPNGSSAFIACDGGTDSAGRAVTVVVKTSEQTGLSARLSIKGATGSENFDFPVLESKKNQLRIFEAPKSDRNPAFALSIGNFNGLTGFATYDLFSGQSGTGKTGMKSKGLLSENRKETNLNLPHCVSQ